ncbi:hypothetical protein CRV03_07160 [Arcobacter sp. F155]|uniref:YegP family protein n=1 Tax=Arcobacter sp. F155 TaxID=2044512 RepID=UPI00100C312C|nr:YegP family protein [Arcobacter sp. F155]RXJ77035.1 hypothetical protein CRV03_07160 [Arcobacter sp. F155]
MKENGYYVLSKREGIEEPYHWVLKAANNEVILTSENYTSKHGALNGIESVRKNCEEDENYQRLEAKDGSPYFNLRAKNHEVIGKSEMYSSKQARDNGIESVKKHGITLALVDETSSSDKGSATSAAATVTVKPERSSAKRYA